ncbi:3430_t:CDS:1, partial [Cetraspora pellucida]
DVINETDNVKIQKILKLITSFRYKKFSLHNRKDVYGRNCQFLRVFFRGYKIRKEVITEIRGIIESKTGDYQIFDLYEDDISTLYAVFIAPRIQVTIDNVKRGFSLTKCFKTTRTLSKNMYNNKFHYITLKFIDDFDAYISMYFDYESVDFNNLLKNELGRVSVGFKVDRAFMGVFCFFKGREIKPFYIVALLLQNDEFPVEYEKINDNCDLVYVKTQTEFFLLKAQLYSNFRPEKTGGWNNLGYDWKFTLCKLYEFGIFSDFMRIATGKVKQTEDIIKWDFKHDRVTISA